MPQKLNRRYKLNIDVDPSTNAGSIQILPPFTVEFEINRAAFSDCPTAKFSVYNLSQFDRDAIYKDQQAAEGDSPMEGDRNYYRGIEFWAGYAPPPPSALQSAFQSAAQVAVALESSQTFPLAFRGNIYQAYSIRSGPNFITKIECQSGQFGIVNGNIGGPSGKGRSYGKGTPLRSIISDLISDLPGIKVGAISEKITGVLKKGNAYYGNPVDAILGLTQNHFFIDHEKAYCIFDDEYVPGSITEINGASGILGVPRKQGQIVIVETIFEPGLKMGQLVSLQTDTVKRLNGPYKITGIQSRGMISESVCGLATTTIQLQNGSAVTSLVVES